MNEWRQLQYYLFMVSPNLKKRHDVAPPVEINESAKKLFQVIYSEKNLPEENDEHTPKIRVSALISRLSFFYEKIRNAVDYDEEHLLRKNAIGRILKRQIVIEGMTADNQAGKISEHLLVELIRGGYLPNNRIPESRIADVSRRLEKYLRLRQHISRLPETGENSEAANKSQLTNWLLALAACEIEEQLAPNRVRQAIVGNMFSILSRNIQLPSDLPYDDDLEIQIYLSISRNYLKFDAEMLTYVLFKYYNSDWLEIDEKGGLGENEDKKIRAIAGNIDVLRTAVDKQLEHPLRKQMDKIVRQYALYFSILAETIEPDPAKAYSSLQSGERSFIALIKKVCAQKYDRAKRRLWRAAIRSIIYIFLTKSIFVLLIEIPAINFFNEPLNLLSLGINITFPALLLFVIVFLTRKPGENNTDKIIAGIKEISFVGAERTKPIVLRRPPRRTWFKALIFNLIYASSFAASVIFIIWALERLQFNWVSTVIFLFFLAFVSFFSVMSTKGMKELIVVERKENIITFFLDLFYMPIILAGRWLSGKFSRLNIFIFFFDFIIETPFKVLVEIAEDWTKYVRERRENLE